MVCIFWHQNCDVKGRVKFSLQGFIMKLTRTLSCVSALFITLTVNAGLIDFETADIGLAFNNFSPVDDISESVTISEPSILGIFSLSLICLASRRFNKKY